MEPSGESPEDIARQAELSGVEPEELVRDLFLRHLPEFVADALAETLTRLRDQEEVRGGRTKGPRLVAASHDPHTFQTRIWSVPAAAARSACDETRARGPPRERLCLLIAGHAQMEIRGGGPAASLPATANPIRRVHVEP